MRYPCVYPPILYRYLRLYFRENISHFISQNAWNFLPMFLVFFERNAYSRVSQRGRENILRFRGRCATRALYVHRENAVDSSFAMHNHFSQPALRFFRDSRLHWREYIFARVSSRFGFQSFTTAFPGCVEYLVTNKADIRVHEKANGPQNPRRTDNIQNFRARWSFGLRGDKFRIACVFTVYVHVCVF